MGNLTSLDRYGRSGNVSPDYLAGKVGSCETDDTRLLTKTAQEEMERVYREGFRYSKAEVLLLDLSPPNEITGDLFAGLSQWRVRYCRA